MKIFDLTGKVAVVTGGNGGIGLGMARGLAQAGATIVVGARNVEKATAAVEELKSYGVESAFISVDVANEKSCRALIASAEQRFGRLDILVNNAGTTVRKRPDECTIEDWQRVMDTNLTGAYLCAQAAYPIMKRQGRGKIINVASGMAFLTLATAMAYSASKAGMVQMGRGLAVAWAADNIQVNNVLPGWTETEFTAFPRLNVQGFADRVTQRTPAGRWGRPGDFAGIAVFLASPASDFVTGGVFAVDGGYTVTA